MVPANNDKESTEASMVQPLEHAFTLFAALLASLVSTHAAVEKPNRLNIVFILADDLGWSDTTLFGTTKFYQTPNLERLAKRGRLYLPAQKDPVQLDWIELNQAQGKSRRWEF